MIPATDCRWDHNFETSFEICDPRRPVRGWCATMADPNEKPKPSTGATKLAHMRTSNAKKPVVTPDKASNTTSTSTAEGLQSLAAESGESFEALAAANARREEFQANLPPPADRGVRFWSQPRSREEMDAAMAPFRTMSHGVRRKRPSKADLKERRRIAAKRHHDRANEAFAKRQKQSKDETANESK